MTANFERPARLGRASDTSAPDTSAPDTSAEVISFDKAARRGRSDQGARVRNGNWLDAEVLELSTQLAVRGAGPLRLVASPTRPRELDRDINGALKRAFDIVVAVVALGLFAPLILVIALGVALESPGPVLFRQFRHGRNRRPFKIYKFRTMSAGSGEDAVLQAKVGDERITRFGALLRRTSLDELPQLLNVLAGQMSIVGPRPHAVRHDVVFERHLPDYHLRFRTKPGIIGLAQLSGARGEIRSRRDIVRRTKLDLLYQRRWTFWLDVRLLCAAPFRLVGDLLSGRSY